jgi:malonate decarboxylase beta subunit
LVEDDTLQVAEAVRQFVLKGVPLVHRSSQVSLYRERIAALDPSRQWDPIELRATWGVSSREEKR